ncbi:shikimate kinase [Natronolimnohabitans innermongolicus]|uniref:Shikimate kinase n=1 Tax=Natronolimnohabitans innermongolicus JCM 12255 TaxID=1227499 RepID=L9WI26_9EURY|nr:shikimate kinase [Natronolimnohabitans innermongolicus]ELY48896.1 shikimate kinase [Natronolimnohabitans innermongolicus JCM 12255]
MDGRAVAPAAGTILTAFATGTGSAFAVDLETTATVELTSDGEFVGEIDDRPEEDTSLIERCAELTVDRYADQAGLNADDVGARVLTESEIPMAAGLTSSSAAANATVLATLDALEIVDSVDRIDACRLGVTAARDVGVTTTGAFDDASASMLGGVTITDNDTDTLLQREEVDWHVLVYTPPERAYSGETDMDACRRIAPMAELVEELALDSRYGEAMTVNGFAYCGALEFSTAPMLEAMPDVTGVTLSGSGPSYVAVGERATLEDVRERWDDREGTTRLLETRTDGTQTRST